MQTTIIKQKVLLGILLISSFMISGCISVPIPARYSAQNFIQVNGVVSLDSFRYIPADKGDLRVNQIEHNAMSGPLVFSSSIAEYVKRANALELNKSGILIKKNSPYQLSAKINKLYAGLLGYSVDWELDITYLLTRKSDQFVLVEKPLHIEFEAGKASYGSLEVYGQSIDELILKAYEQLISDPTIQELLNK